MPIKDDSLEVYGRKHPVPQNVMDVEFKVVGDLTVRQFMYLIFGSLLIFLFYKAQLPKLWTWFFIFITGSISIAVAFVPIEERGMDIWLANFVKAMLKPTQRIWKKMEVIPAYFLVDYSQSIQSQYTITPTKNKNKLAEFLNQINEEQELDESEQERLSEINMVLANSPTSTFVKEQQKKVFATTKEESKELTKPDLAEIMVDEINTKIYIASPKTLEPMKPEISRPLVNIPSKLKKEIKHTQQTRKQVITKPKKPQKAITKRKIEEHGLLLEKQVKELKETTKRAKEEFLNNPHKKEQKLKKIEFFNKKLFELKNEREKLNFRIHNKKKEDIAKEEKEQIEKLKNKNSVLEKQLEDIKKDLDSIKKGGIKTTDTKTSDNDTENKIIFGTVQDSDGTLIESAVIIIKDKNGDVVRALKTNKLGKFKAQTPIDEGVYTIEAIKSGKSFDILSIELGDEQLKPVTLLAK